MKTILITALVLMLAGCGGDDSGPTGPTTGGGGTTTGGTTTTPPAPAITAPESIDGSKLTATWNTLISDSCNWDNFEPGTTVELVFSDDPKRIDTDAIDWRYVTDGNQATITITWEEANHEGERLEEQVLLTFETETSGTIEGLQILYAMGSDTEECRRVVSGTFTLVFDW